MRSPSPVVPCCFISRRKLSSAETTVNTSFPSDMRRLVPSSKVYFPLTYPLIGYESMYMYVLISPPPKLYCTGAAPIMPLHQSALSMLPFDFISCDSTWRHPFPSTQRVNSCAVMSRMDGTRVSSSSSHDVRKNNARRKNSDVIEFKCFMVSGLKVTVANIKRFRISCIKKGKKTSKNVYFPYVNAVFGLTKCPSEAAEPCFQLQLHLLVVDEAVAVAPSVAARGVDMQRCRHVVTVHLDVVVDAVGGQHGVVVVA